MKQRLIPLAVLVVMGVSLSAAPTAHAAAGGSTHSRAVAVASSGDWLVYKRQVSTSDLTPSPQKGDLLYATDTAGHVTHLTDFQRASTGRLSLVDDFLVQASRPSGQAAQQVRYRDLATGTTAQVTAKAHDVVVSAAPDGWVVQREGRIDPSSEFSLVRVRPDGTETGLGVPFPDYIDGGVGYLLQPSDSGLIAYPLRVDEVCASSQVRFQPWSDPGGWRTIYSGAARSCIGCAPATASSVACRATQPDKGLVVISLRGRAPHYLRNSHPRLCQSVDYATSKDDLVAIETTDAGACTKGEVYRFGQDKKLAISKGRYDALGSIRAGLGRIVVSKRQQQLIYGLSGVTRSPTVVARA